MLRRVTAGSLLLALASGLALGAETYEDRIDVLEVRVPVNVIDAAGAAVRGLESRDFTIVEGRREVEIVDFRVVDLETLQPTSDRIDLDHVLPADGRRHFLLVFDLTFSKPSAILQAQRAARNLVLESFHPTDVAALMTFSERAGLQLLVTFTSDRAQLARAIDLIGREDLASGGALDPLRFVIDDSSAGLEGRSAMSSASSAPMSAADGAREAMALSEQILQREARRQERSFERGRIESWVAQLGFLADSLQEVAGRTHVVYFSEGFDDRLLMGQGAEARMAEERLAAQIGRQIPTDSDSTYGDISLITQITRVLQEFKRSGVSIQAVDLSGVPARGGSSFFHATLARETGGTVVDNTNRLEQDLAAILRGSSTTYLLTIQVEGVRPDGSYHPIEVRVRGAEAAQVVYRPGYYAPEPYGDLHPLEKALLAADALAAATPRTEIAIDLLVASFQATGEASYVPVIVEIGGDSLLTGQDEEHLPLEIYAYASDSRGRMIDFFTQLLTLSSSSARESLRGSGLKYYGHLELPPGDHLVRVMVRNGTTGRAGVASARLEVPRLAAGEPALVGPFVAEAPGRWLLVREQRGATGTRVVYPFTVKEEAFVPAALPVLGAGRRERLVLVAYGLGNGDLELSGEILDADGAKVPGAVLGLEERTDTGVEGYDKLLVSFRPDGIEPGEYTLRVTVHETGSPVSPTSTMSFRVGG